MVIPVQFLSLRKQMVIQISRFTSNRVDTMSVLISPPYEVRAVSETPICKASQSNTRTALVGSPLLSAYIGLHKVQRLLWVDN
jgi:hypothetical protein